MDGNDAIDAAIQGDLQHNVGSPHKTHLSDNEVL